MPSTKASTKPTHRMAISDVWCGIDRPVGGGENDSEALARSMQRAPRDRRHATRAVARVSEAHPGWRATSPEALLAGMADNDPGCASLARATPLRRSPRRRRHQV